MKKLERFLITDINSFELKIDEKKWLESDLIYGILLFSKNYQNPIQISQLIQSIKSINPKLKIFVDQEGGRVQRFNEGFKKIKPMQHLGLDYEHNRKKSKKRAKRLAKVMAKELVKVGVDVNLAPVVDCDYGNENGAIKDRSFHRNPKIVYQLAKRMVEGFQSEHLKACLKHFPGHGYISLDTHFHFAKDERSFEKLREEIQIYFWMIEHFKSEIQYIMLAHIFYPSFDNLPVFLSHKWIQYLREVIGFKGKIISDDLNMKAAQKFGSVIDLTEKSLNAGCDLIIICNNQKAKQVVLNF